MRMSASAALILLAVARPARAHDYPIKPVLAVLHVEPDRTVVDLDSDSIYWIEEVVGLHPMPASDWPQDALSKTEAYVNDHLKLALGGHRLTGRLIAASYIQRPWQVYEQGRFRLRLVYPPATDGETLSGEADFFEDYRQERLQEKQPLLPIQDFRTILTVPGKVAHRFELKPGAMSFSVSVVEARRTAAARFFESFKIGARVVLSAAPAWPALAALALSLAPGAPSPRKIAAAASAILLGAAPWPWAAPAWLPWAAGAIAAISAGRWLGAAIAAWLETATCAALGHIWMPGVFPNLPRAAPTVFERGPAAFGLLVACSAMIAVALLVLKAERLRLATLSQSRATELFERRRRFSAILILIICLFGFLQK